MTIIDIENMTAEELKAQRAEAVKSTGDNELAARYVQARLDAKQRDEKLAEQGVTITTLTKALADSNARADAAVADAKATAAQLAAAKDATVQTGHKLQAEIAARQEDLNKARVNADAQAKEINRLDLLAKARRVALSGVSDIATQAIAGIHAAVTKALAE